MREQRVGFGYDAHRFGGAGPIWLCGVEIDHPIGIEATSDGDVAAHAVCDAILGAAAIGDLGKFFSSSDPEWADVRSVDLTGRCTSLVFDRGFEIVNVDVTIVAESVRIAPHRDAMRGVLSASMRTQIGAVSVKATSTDGLGWVGANEGIAAHAVVTLQR